MTGQMLLSVPMTHDPDCCISILTDIDGSLANVILQTFARTCFLYYNLCLCKYFKEHAPEGARSKVQPPPERRLHLICGCKGTAFPETDKIFHNFFQIKT